MRAIWAILNFFSSHTKLQKTEPVQFFTLTLSTFTFSRLYSFLPTIDTQKHFLPGTPSSHTRLRLRQVIFTIFLSSITIFPVSPLQQAVCRCSIPPLVPTPFIGNSAIWYRPRILQSSYPCLSRCILCTPATYFQDPLLSLHLHPQGTPPRGMAWISLVLSHTHSQPLILAHFYSSLPLTELQNYSIRNPRATTLRKTLRKHQQPKKRTSSQ